MADRGDTQSRGVRHRRARARWFSLGALVLAAAAVAAVLVTRGGAKPPGSGDGTPRASPTSSGSPARPDLARLTLPRGPLCRDLSLADVRAVLGGRVARRSSYVPGQRVVLAPGLRDVSHEYSCQFRAATGAQARVWVFAAPVTRRVAGALARDARSQKRCRPAGLETRLGVPSAGTLCAGPIGAGRRPDRVMVLRGLFGDAWLSCQLTTPPTVAAGEVVRRADRWCVQVATTLGGLS